MSGREPPQAKRKYDGEREIEKLVFELATMTQAKFICDLLLLARSVPPSALFDAVYATWDAQKKTLAGHFALWDEPIIKEDSGRA